MILSLRELTNKVTELEKVNHLFGWQINGVYIWEIIRYQVYSVALHVNFEKSEKLKLPITKRISELFTRISYKVIKDLNALVYQPFFDKNVVDVLVFESSRKLLFNDEYIDPYTEFTCQELEAEGKSLTRYQSSFFFDRLAKKRKHVKSLDLLSLFLRIKLKSGRTIFSKSDIERIEQINVLINRDLNISIDLQDLIDREIRVFNIMSNYFRSILKNKNPKDIYLVNFCDKSALIAVAKEMKIRVTDIQHGLISSDDIIYNYPDVKEDSLHYFPDRFFAWSPIWSEVSKLPLSGGNIINYGNKYLENQKLRFSRIGKNEGQVIVISQPGFTHSIATEILRIRESLKNFKVLYKLHPAEGESAFQIPEINELFNQNNIRFVKRNEDLYNLLATSVYAIGLGSTALIEALTFDCRVFLLDLPGVEWMEPFIDNDKVRMFDSFAGFTNNNIQTQSS